MSYLPLSHAAFNISNPSSSSITQSNQSLLPIPMVPRIGAETRRPEEPSWTYSTLVAFTLLCSEAGTGGAGIFLLEKVFESKVNVHEVSMLSTASACNKALYRQRDPPADRDRLTQRTYEMSSSREQASLTIGHREFGGDTHFESIS